MDNNFRTSQNGIVGSKFRAEGICIWTIVSYRGAIWNGNFDSDRFQSEKFQFWKVILASEFQNSKFQKFWNVHFSYFENSEIFQKYLKNSNSENIWKILIPKISEKFRFRKIPKNSEISESEMILKFPKFRNRNRKPFLNSENFRIFSETVNSDLFHSNGTPSRSLGAC